MFKFNVKWTPAQMLIFHIAISGLISSIVAGLLAAGQYIVATGVNFPELGRIFSVAFIASFTACYLSIKNNPNTAQAIMDGVNELKGLVVQQPAPIAPQGPPVVVNVTHPAIVEPPAPQAAVRSLSAFPVPPRPIVQPPIQMPAVQQPPDIAAVNTMQVPVPPSLPDMPQRSFDSSVLRAVQPGQ